MDKAERSDWGQARIDPSAVASQSWPRITAAISPPARKARRSGIWTGLFYAHRPFS
jgi:hypothetical protein